MVKHKIYGNNIIITIHYFCQNQLQNRIQQLLLIYKNKIFLTTNIYNIATLNFVVYINDFIGVPSYVKMKIDYSV